MFPRSEILIERESKAEFVLGRVESPGFQHTAVMLGCVEPSEAAPVANNYRNTAHTRRHIPIGGSVVDEGGVPSQHTAVLLGGVESRCPGRFLWTGV